MLIAAKHSQTSDPPWLLTALQELGVTETPGPEATPRILEYNKWVALPPRAASQDETAWCSCFMNFCFGTHNLIRTNSAMARSWERWGTALPKPIRGAVAVFTRTNDPAHGHVALILEVRGNKLSVIGGNQGNLGCVSIKTYPVGRLVTVRWPTDYAHPLVQ